LHVFANEIEWVVARSLEDAKAVLHELSHPVEGAPDDIEEQFEDGGWSQEPDDAEMHIWLDAETGDISDGGLLVNGQMDAWAEAFGRGYLCSTEY
jgi:hypothetical protein